MSTLSNDTLISGAEALLSQFSASGIDYIFANAGTDFASIIEAYGNKLKSGLEMPEPLVIVHENVAVGMAHGYYLATGQVQVVMVHVNVGLANAAMATLNAASDDIPVVLCSGRTPVSEKERFGARSTPIHWGQEMRDQGSLVREATKWDFELRYGDQASVLAQRAVAISAAAPQGPVYLSLPREALAERFQRQPALSTAFAEQGPPATSAISEAADILAGAERPVIIAHRADTPETFHALSGLAGRFALPVVEFWATRNALPASHPMNVGRNPQAWLADADVVVEIDASVPFIPDQVTIPDNCRHIAIGTDPDFKRLPLRGFQADVKLAGNVSGTIEALSTLMEGRVEDTILSARRSRIQDRRDQMRAANERRIAAASTGKLTTAWVSTCLSRTKAEDAAVFNELGCDLSLMDFNQPRSLFSNPLAGGLGWAVPAALGMQLADRARQVIACVGDGSYIFANPAACHQTAALHNLPILVIVFNNNVWNAVRRATLSMYPDGEAAEMTEMPLTQLGPSPDYCAIASAHGAFAQRVDAPDAMMKALETAFHVIKTEKRQALLEVIVPV